MELALYHPRVGYYSRRVRLGSEGDYYTSPELHPFFAAALAAQTEAIWTQLGRPRPFEIVEVGGGSARFARDFLIYSAEQLPEFADALTYRIDDASETLREQQRRRLARADLDGRVRWTTGRGQDWPPDTLVGAIIANELLDALPVHLVTLQSGSLMELYVVDRDGLFALEPGPVSTLELHSYFARLGIELTEGARAEMNLAARAWLQRAAASLHAGALFLMDYGYEATELFAPHRRQGTLLCYAGHAVSSDPLARPGQQDITTHVDLTTVRHTLDRSGLTILWQRSQADALAQAGFGEWLGALPSQALPWTERSTAVRSLQALVEPDGLGKIEWLAASKSVDVGALATGPAVAPASRSTGLGDHLRLPDPASMDPIPDVEAQWRELWEEAAETDN